MKRASKLAVALLALGISLSSVATAPASAAVVVQDLEQSSIDLTIVGGKVTAKDVPWTANLYGCGGTLVAPDWVVTAAHCLKFGVGRIRLGSKDKFSGGELIKGDKYWKHPKYDGKSPGYDIGLIHLATPSKIKPIPIAREAGSVGTKSLLLGWGATTAAGTDSSRLLKELDVSILDGSKCTSDEDGFDPAREICTSYPGGNQGSCYGDSGGPQVKWINNRWELIGATSRGPEKCATGPSIYTSVPAHIAWLREVSNNQIPMPNGMTSVSEAETTTGDEAALVNEGISIDVNE